MPTSNLIARIEGHGHLKLDMANHKAHLVVSEGERLFEQLVRGRDFQEAPFIACRICGICPVAHSLGSIKALENALGVKVNETIINLRKLMLCCQIINSHLIHLFFLVLPDFTPEKERGIEIIKLYPVEYHMVLKLKKICDRLLEIITGRVVHPITPMVGGFTQEPDRDRLSSLILDIEQVFSGAEELISIFSHLEYPKISNFNPSQICLDNDKDYSYYDGQISCLTGFKADPGDYQKLIIEQVKYGSPVKYSSFTSKPFVVGALSRLNQFKNRLHRRTNKVLKDMALVLPEKNPFFINVAQAIEIFHFLEEALNLLYWFNRSPQEEVQVEIPFRSGVGSAAIEAPRGTLYYSFEVKDGKVVYCNILTPTAQNLAAIEEAATSLLTQNKNRPIEEQHNLIEILIRSFDPCITCAVH